MRCFCWIYRSAARPGCIDRSDHQRGCVADDLFPLLHWKVERSLASGHDKGLAGDLRAAIVFNADGESLGGDACGQGGQDDAGVAVVVGMEDGGGDGVVSVGGEEPEFIYFARLERVEIVHQEDEAAVGGVVRDATQGLWFGRRLGGDDMRMALGSLSASSTGAAWAASAVSRASSLD